MSVWKDIAQQVKEGHIKEAIGAASTFIGLEQARKDIKDLAEKYRKLNVFYQKRNGAKRNETIQDYSDIP